MTREIDIDTLLVQRAVDGEREAFSELLRRHDRLMRSVAWRIVGRYNLVDDALQDAYVNAYCSMGRFRSDGQFAAWLRRIVVNTCIDHLRRNERRREEPIENEEAVVAPPGTLEGVADALQLHQALCELPSEQRVTLVLVEMEGYSYDEVAAMMDASPGTVGSRLSRARSTLRAVLETYE